MASTADCAQAIVADEVKRELKGERARRIQEIIDAIATHQQDVDICEAALEDYIDDDEDFPEEGEQMIANLNARLIRAR